MNFITLGDIEKFAIQNCNLRVNANYHKQIEFAVCIVVMSENADIKEFTKVMDEFIPVGVLVEIYQFNWKVMKATKIMEWTN